MAKIMILGWLFSSVALGAGIGAPAGYWFGNGMNG